VITALTLWNVKIPAQVFGDSALPVTLRRPDANAIAEFLDFLYFSIARKRKDGALRKPR
jgi:hypothetical protein